MPTNNRSNHTHLEFSECIDILHMICGDLNGSLLEPMPYYSKGANIRNRHNQVPHLTFMKDHNFSHSTSYLNTFFHYSGPGSSQRDFITSSEKNLIHSHRIGFKGPENTSSHVIVHSYLSTRHPEGGLVKIKSLQKVLPTWIASPTMKTKFNCM